MWGDNREWKRLGQTGKQRLPLRGKPHSALVTVPGRDVGTRSFQVFQEMPKRGLFISNLFTLNCGLIFFFLKNTLVPPQKTILLYEEVVCRLLDGASGTVGRGSGEQGSSPGSAPLQHLWLGKDLTSLSLLPYNGPYLIVLLTRINKMIHVPRR